MYYRNSHCRELPLSYPYNEISYTGKISLYWIKPQNLIKPDNYNEQERFKRRNTLGCLDQYAAQNSKYARPQIPSHPQPQRSSSSGTLNMIPPWNIHTVKQSMPRSCSNGCSLNWFIPSEFFQFSQLTNSLVSLKNANDVHNNWVWN